MNKIFISILLTFSLNLPLVCATNDKLHFTCAPQLQRSFDKIKKIPEAITLMSAIQKEGPIRIIAQNTNLSDQFGAYWDPDLRIICISLSANTSEASIIGSILFELHNASANSQINHLDQLASKREITKSHYVESMEYIEYVNSINTANLTKKGIEMGAIPSESLMHTYSSFKEHYSVQKKSGHSSWFANTYDNMRN